MTDPDYSVVTERAGRAQQVCEALVALLDAADRDEEFYDTVGAVRFYSSAENLADVGLWVKVLVDAKFTRRRRTSNGTYARYVVVDIAVLKHLSADASEDVDEIDKRKWLLEQIENYLAAPNNHDLELPDDKLAQYVEGTDPRAPDDVRDGLGILHDPDMLDTHRQFTGLVRVAYWVDEDY